MDKFKTDLLKRSYYAGIVPFLSELLLMIKDKFLGPTHLVFEMRKESFTSFSTEENCPLEISVCATWEQVPEHIKRAILEELHGQYWGKESWLELGWRLWVGTLDQKLAIVSWSREAGQCEDFFFPLSDNCALIWQTFTVPRFRGKGLAPYMYKKVLRELFNWGNLRVFVSCRKYNLASRKVIEKSGFKYIGYGIVRKKNGRGIWYPINKPFTQG